MSFLDTFAQMLVLFFAMACGYAANRLGYLDDHANRSMSSLLLNILMPCTILSSVMGENLPEPGDILAFLGICAVFYGMEAVFVLFIPRLLGGTAAQKNVWSYVLMFANIAFVGYPVALALLGEEGLFYAVILALPFNLLFFSLGPLLLAGAKRFQARQLLSPGILASLLGLFLALSRLRPPALAGEMLSFLGDVTVPISLVLVGSMLAGLPVGRIFTSPRLWFLTLVRLFLMPAVLWLLLRPFPVDRLVMGVVVLEMGMPAAIGGSMQCLEYGGDADSMAQTIFLSTVAAIFSIPVVASVFL